MTLLKTALFLFCALPAFAAPNCEVVGSFPLETDLGVSGIRQTQEVWLEMFRAAKHQIDLEQFYVSDQAGEALSPVLQSIAEAAARGVQVRLLVDSKFYKTYPDSVKQLGKLANVQTRTIDFSETNGVQHAKFFTIDGLQNFVGSQNFDWRALSHIHEIGLRVSDAKVSADLESIFETDWAAAGGAPLKTKLKLSKVRVTEGELSVVASPEAVNPDSVGSSFEAIAQLLKSAQTSVRIQNMEYTTRGAKGQSVQWQELDSAVRKAAARGVHVELMVDVSDLKKGKKDLEALAALENIEVKIVTIPAWSGGAIDFARLIHSKYMVVDDAVAWVGSENWSQKYFISSRNVGLLVRLPDIAVKLGQVFDRLWHSPYGQNLLR